MLLCSAPVKYPPLHQKHTSLPQAFKTRSKCPILKSYNLQSLTLHINDQDLGYGGLLLCICLYDMPNNCQLIKMPRKHYFSRKFSNNSVIFSTSMFNMVRAQLDASTTLNFEALGVLPDAASTTLNSKALRARHNKA